MKNFLFFSFILLSLPLLSEPPISGEVIASTYHHYQVIQKLGTGAFGRVYEVQDSQNELFALKWFKSKKHLKGISALYADAKREFILGQTFHHPHIIKSIEHFTQEKDAYVILEYVKGKPLGKIQKNILSIPQGKKICLDLIDALQYALSLEFIFLDLYENNLMITSSFELKLIDLSSFVSFYDIKKILQMKKNKADFNKLTEPEKEHLTRFVALHPELQSLTLSPVLARNFDKTTTVLLQILDRTHIHRSERVKIKEAIKKLDWHCQNESDASQSIHLSTYFAQLSDLISALIQ